jgi:hypothetical protein
LRSIKRYAAGFNKVHICIPSDDITHLPAGNEEVHLVNRWEDDYIGQQNDKLHADQFCSSPYILCIDSDCIFTREVTPHNFFFDGKPVWFYEKPVPENLFWLYLVEQCCGFYPEYEYMRRHPFVFRRDCLIEFRKFMHHHSGKELSKFLKDRPKRHFSEFNCYGAWCHVNRKEDYQWMHPSLWPVFVKQYKLGRISQEIDESTQKELESILA